MNKDKLAQEIRKHLQNDSKWWKRNGSEYSGPAPSLIRSGSDSNMFHVDFNKGAYYDHKTRQGGNLNNLAFKLNIKVSKGFSPIKTAIPQNLREYEAFRGLPENYLRDRNWRDGEFMGRKCIFIPTPSGIDQVRFLDDLDPKYIPVKKLPEDENGNKIHGFYGLRKAIEIAKNNDLGYLVHCNGAISSEVAQYHGIPAFCILGGENSYGEHYIRKVFEVTELPIVIALDSDTTGQLGTKRLLEMYGNRGIAIDFEAEFGSGFDLCDFCILFENAKPSELIAQKANSAYNARPPRTIREAGKVVIAKLRGEIAQNGRVIPNPFNTLRSRGGGASWMQIGLLSGIIGVSGGGKTMFWQSLAELLLRQQRKWGIIVDSREFKTEDDYSRKITQQTSPLVSYDDIQSHLQWQQIQKELSDGLKLNDDEIAIGKVMNDEKFNSLVSFQRRTEMYPGLLEYADEKLFIEDTLDYMYRRTLELRASGHYVDLWIFDYLTLYKLKVENQKISGDNIYNVILDFIKSKARKAGLHALVMLQTNKDPTSDLQSRNRLLTMSDIAYASPNHFNFIMSINPLTGTQAAWNSEYKRWLPIRDSASGEPVKDLAKLSDGTYAAIWKCLKNSNGNPSWQLRMKADFKRLTWLDETWESSDLLVPLDAGDSKRKGK